MFNIGDMIKVLDGSQEEDYYGGWYSGMGYLVGNTYEIIDRISDRGYTIKEEYGNTWTIDARYAVLADEKEIVVKLPAPPTVMNTKSDFALTVMQRHELVNEIDELLQKYEYRESLNYDPTPRGINAMLDEWQEQNGWIIDWMRKSPYYNGKGQIILTENYARKIDMNVVYDFTNYIFNTMTNRETKLKIGDKIKFKTEEELYKNEIAIPMWMTDFLGREVTVGRVYNDGDIEIEEDFREHYFSFKIYTELPENSFFWEEKQKVFFRSYLDNNVAQYADEVFCKVINEAFPWLKAHNGAKVSRLINRVCKKYGFDKEDGFNAQYTRFADAVNPLSVTRYTVISCHPVDYLTMSFGKSWASCHTIDKTNIRCMPNDYTGCYSGGTLSYMLDPSSVVVYVIDESYEGNTFELEAKLSRQMFHIGEDKIVQGRLYPQDNDVGSADTYKQTRETVQRVVSECLGVPNSWYNKKGTGECCSVIRSYGAHYRDYEDRDNCNVSYLKHGDNVEYNYTKIQVGAEGICPRCGERHENSECILCEDCMNKSRCAECGDPVDSIYGDGIIAADGTAFCCSYCAESAGYVYCTNTEDYRDRDTREVFYDNYLEEYQYDWYERYITTEDGHHYANEENARNDGYMEDSNGDWYPEDEFHECPKCGQIVHDNEWDDEKEMCEECATGEELDSNIEVNGIVYNGGCTYSSYERWVEKYAKGYKGIWDTRASAPEGIIGKIVAHGKHDTNGLTLYAIVIDRKMYVVGEDGIRIMKEVA